MFKNLFVFWLNNIVCENRTYQYGTLSLFSHIFENSYRYVRRCCMFFTFVVNTGIHTGTNKSNFFHALNAFNVSRPIMYFSNFLPVL
jgi:hypothetical protein